MITKACNKVPETSALFLTVTCSDGCAGLGLLQWPVTIVTGGHERSGGHIYAAVEQMLQEQLGVCVSEVYAHANKAAFTVWPMPRQS